MPSPALLSNLLLLAMPVGACLAQVASVPVFSTNGQSGISKAPEVRREGDAIHLAFDDGIQALGVAYVRSDEGGRTWTAPRHFAGGLDRTGSLATAGAMVYLVNEAAWHVSSDGGRTWSSTPNTTGLFVGKAVAVGTSCHVVLRSSMMGPGPHTIAYVRTVDGGSTWSIPVVLGNPQGYVQPSLDVEGNTIHVHWSEGLTMHQSSADGGATWRAAPLVLGSAPGVGHQFAASGNFVHVVRNAASVEYLRSADAGVTWQSPVLLPGSSSDGRLAVAGANVYVTLTQVFGAHGRFVASSSDDGASWSLATLSSVSGGSSIGASGQTVCVAWSDGTAAKIAVSGDRGATWQVSNGSGPVYFPGWAHIALEPPFVAVAWWNRSWLWTSFTWSPVYLDVSTDFGATWHIQQRFGDPLSSGPVTFVPSSDSCGLLWADGTAAFYGSTVLPTNLHYGTIFGHEHYGTPKVGSGGIAPALHPIGLPRIGSTVDVTMSGMLGGALSLVGVSLAGEADVPLGSGRLLLATPSSAVWGVASGASGLPGAGTSTLRLSIPNVPALRQLRIWCQGFALDPGALDGFASTAGLKLVVL